MATRLESPISPHVSKAWQAFVAEFHAANPIHHVVIDNFLEDEFAVALLDGFPSEASMPKSRDYVFSNKRELSTVDSWTPSSMRLHELLTSDAFSDHLSELLDVPLFIDPEYLGGGFHLGGDGSFLDLHTDFNIHPLNRGWYRRLNLLLYLNPGWEPDWGGELLLTPDPSRAPTSVAPLFNRLVIMESSDTSFHGYQTIRFPQGRKRRSIAAYAYSLDGDSAIARRTTNWAPVNARRWKKALAKNWNPLVQAKNRLLGPGTAKNRRGR